MQGRPTTNTSSTAASTLDLLQSFISAGLIEALSALIVYWLLIYFLDRVLEPRFGKVGMIGSAIGTFVVVFLCLLGVFLNEQNGTIAFSGYLGNEYLYQLIVAVFLSLHTLVFRKGGLLQKLFWILVSYSFYLISHVASNALMLAFFDTIDTATLPFYIHALLCLITIILMGNFLRPITRKRMSSVWMSPKVMLILTLIPLISCAILLSIYHHLIIPFGQDVVYALLLLALSLGIGIIVYCSFALFKTQYSQARKELRQQALLQEASLSKIHLDEVSALYSATREWRHDYINNLQILLGYVESEDHEGLAEYLISLSESISIINTRFNVGDGLINAILNAKAARSDTFGINLIVSGSISSVSTSFGSTDIASLIGNILDNAIEACQRAQEAGILRGGPFEIVLTLSESDNDFRIYAKNPTDGKVRMSGGFFPTSKNSPDHGLGSGLIDAVVEKYNGYIDRTVTENVFEVFVLLQRPSQ